MVALRIVVGVVVFLSVLVVPELPGQSGGRTVLDGVYSEAQAGRGRLSYAMYCGGCHGDRLEGVSAPELTGKRFVERWREGMLDSIHGFLKERMPPRRDGSPSPIPDSDYVDILTYILRNNGYRSGESELRLEQLAEIMLVGENGPQPVPDGALVMTVGCLAPRGESSWMLAEAAEPVRTRVSTSASEAELSASAARPLGPLVFRLADLEAIPDFDPAAHTGQKLQIKGYLIRQPNAERISVSAIHRTGATCQ